jgi:hypothetical protein
LVSFPDNGEDVIEKTHQWHRLIHYLTFYGSGCHGLPRGHRI